MPKYPRCHGSDPGPFYVDAEACCDCESDKGAPGLPFTRCFGPGGQPSCRFARQPETEQEITQAIEAINSCAAIAVRYAGIDKTILDRITGPECCDALCDS